MPFIKHLLQCFTCILNYFLKQSCEVNSYYLLQKTKLPKVTYIVTHFFHLASSSFTIQPIATVPPIIRDYSGARSTTLKTA